MIQTTKWSPDTCSCILSYTWDDGVPVEQRIQKFNKLENMCPEHQGFLPEEIYAAVLEENQTKNIVMNLLIDSIPTLTDPIVLDDGTPGKGFKKEKTPGYTFIKIPGNPVRSLAISDTFTGQEKTAIETVLDNNLGVGKVSVE